MKINKVVLYNFNSYEGFNEFDFSSKSEKKLLVCTKEQIQIQRNQFIKNGIFARNVKENMTIIELLMETMELILQKKSMKN